MNERKIDDERTLELFWAAVAWWDWADGGKIDAKVPRAFEWGDYSVQLSPKWLLTSSVAVWSLTI